MQPTEQALPLTLPALDFDHNAATAWGHSLSQRYNEATPFPHIVLDNFLHEDLIASLCAHFPVEPTHNEMLYERGYKGQSKRQISPLECDAHLKAVFNAFNSAPMLLFLESLTGIQGLIPDPYFTGGGLHETKSGGFLGVHSDFRLNKKLKIERRINIIIYLNQDWREEYGGNLELWSPDMKTCLKKILPIYNRCVIFNTDKDSNHGHPEPLTTPEHVTRRSIALYYYTSGMTAADPSQRNKTHYKPRPKDLLSLNYHLNKLLRKKN
ncbi:2OG-Fe(II) oxygenase [Pseudomonas massiliensis]|uniref:2OG-Fe(II) oxygenase n=1 Tax=Pseudomonas massiliensis TaxID=522492 RepID=UPI00058E7BB4|nr:2OG-Fe(II) oxygenase [Pseudomonas massiliensis]